MLLVVRLGFQEGKLDKTKVYALTMFSILVLLRRKSQEIIDNFLHSVRHWVLWFIEVVGLITLCNFRGCGNLGMHGFFVLA
jgi:hypothetical protein